MWEVLKYGGRAGGGLSLKLALVLLAMLAGVFALVASVSAFTSPFVLCPVLLLALVLAIRALGRRVEWERYGSMPPLSTADMRRVQHRLLNNHPSRTYECRLRPDASRHRGLARI